MADTLERIRKSLNDADYQVIETDKATAQKITSAFINRGWWFMVYHVELSYYIVTSTTVDLNWYRRRGYEFTLG